MARGGVTEVIDALLQGVERTGASVAIIVISGVREVDSHTADGVLRAARSVRLKNRRLGDGRRWTYGMQPGLSGDLGQDRHSRRPA